MTNNSDKIIQDAKLFSLSHAEKSAMRERVESFVVGTPATEKPVPSPISIYDVRTRLSSLIPHRAWKHYAPLALGLILTMGIGTSYAAEGALPGDMLYPVKISVNEGLESFFAGSSSKSNAKVGAQQALRRLDEAETLARTGRLDEKAHKNIKKNFSNKVKALDQGIQKLQLEGDFDSSIEVNMEFEDGLNKHGDILLSFIDETTAAPAVPAIAEMANSVRAMRSATLMSTQAGTTTDDSSASALMQVEAGAAPTEDTEEPDSGRKKRP